MAVVGMVGRRKSEERRVRRRLIGFCFLPIAPARDSFPFPQNTHSRKSSCGAPLLPSPRGVCARPASGRQVIERECFFSHGHRVASTTPTLSLTHHPSPLTQTPHTVAACAAATTATAARAAHAAHTAGLSRAAAVAGALCAAAAASVALSPPAFAAPAHAGERSFIMVKPDGVHRGLVGPIIARYEAKGWRLVGLKVLVPPRALAAEHYAEHSGRPFFGGLVDFLSSGPVVAMVWEGAGVVAGGRALIGQTNPAASPPGTIRGDFGLVTGRNLIHGSDSVTSAQREIALWFRPSELAEYTAHNAAWVYEGPAAAPEEAAAAKAA
jgi:nucleoside-diphosphate kinase